METHIQYVVKRTDGVLVNVHYCPVESINRALKFKNLEDLNYFISDGHYRAENPEDYYGQKIKITYEEVHEDECI